LLRLANHSTSGGTSASRWNSAAVSNRLTGAISAGAVRSWRGLTMLPGGTPATWCARRYSAASSWRSARPGRTRCGAFDGEHAPIVVGDDEVERLTGFVSGSVIKSKIGRRLIRLYPGDRTLSGSRSAGIGAGALPIYSGRAEWVTPWESRATTEQDRAGASSRLVVRLAHARQ
jgi:hypothetical protein